MDCFNLLEIEFGRIVQNKCPYCHNSNPMHIMALSSCHHSFNWCGLYEPALSGPFRVKHGCMGPRLKGHTPTPQPRRCGGPGTGPPTRRWLGLLKLAISMFFLPSNDQGVALWINLWYPYWKDNECQRFRKIAHLGSVMTRLSATVVVFMATRTTQRVSFLCTKCCTCISTIG